MSKDANKKIKVDEIFFIVIVIPIMRNFVIPLLPLSFKIEILITDITRENN